jgi:hypothetical protein
MTIDAREQAVVCWTCVSSDGRFEGFWSSWDDAWAYYVPRKDHLALVRLTGTAILPRVKD